MKSVRIIMFLALAISCLIAEASGSMMRTPRDGELKALQVKQAATVKAHISPELEPKSSSKFFKKDYPFDKRPKADPFHFNHPYPVVQDSNEFDADFVKDENSDNGNWKAQETYDRLRAKLAKEKRDLAKALAKKREEENELEVTKRRHAKEKKEFEEAREKADKLDRDAQEEKKKQEQEDAEKEEKEKRETQEETQERKKRPAGEPAEKEKTPTKTKVFDVDGQSKKTEEAMNKLEDCKKELAKAREQLKELMKELEAAKAQQNAANAELDEAMQKELSAKEVHAKQKKEVKSEYDEYLAAKKAYEKQKALVEKMEADLKKAAAKVKAMRDSADKDGGVYPTPEERPRSGAVAAHCWLALLLAAVAGLAAA